jgi:hypothetical protein
MKNALLLSLVSAVFVAQVCAEEAPKVEVTPVNTTTTTTNPVVTPVTPPVINEVKVELKSEPVIQKTEDAVKTADVKASGKKAVMMEAAQKVKTFFKTLDKRDYAIIGGTAAATAVLYYAIASMLAGEDEEFSFDA